MKTIKSKSKVYHYTCVCCGNEFSKDYDVEPTHCENCGGMHTFFVEVHYVDTVFQYCPICGTYFKVSNQSDSSKSDGSNWLQNMISHYRDNHLRKSSMNRYNFMNGWDTHCGINTNVLMDEIAKRQVLKRCGGYMLENGIKPKHLKKIGGTGAKTIALYNRFQKIKQNNGYRA